MKDFINKFNDFKNSPNGKPIIFFAFYGLFFLLIFGIIALFGDKNALIKDYERGNQSNFSNQQILNNNFYYDYKVTLDGTLHDYYGKVLGNVESFKYNNNDYYKKDNDYFINNNSIWTKTDNPFIFREFIETSNIDKIMNEAYYVSKTEYENKDVDYNFIISVNNINKILYNTDSDYDDNPSEIVIKLDKNGAIKSIIYKLDNYCSYKDTCNNLKIELNYSLFGEVIEIENPIE